MIDQTLGLFLILSLPWVFSPYILLKLIGLRFLQVFIHHMIHRPDCFGRHTKLVAWMCSWLCGWPMFEAFSDMHKYDHLIQSNKWQNGSIFSIHTFIGIFYLPFSIHYRHQSIYLICSCIVWVGWLFFFGFFHWFKTLLTFVASIFLFTSKQMHFDIITNHMRHASIPFYSLDKDAIWQWFFCPLVSPMLHL